MWHIERDVCETLFKKEQEYSEKRTALLNTIEKRRKQVQKMDAEAESYWYDYVIVPLANCIGDDIRNYTKIDPECRISQDDLSDDDWEFEYQVKRENGMSDYYSIVIHTSYFRKFPIVFYYATDGIHLERFPSLPSSGDIVRLMAHRRGPST